MAKDITVRVNGQNPDGSVNISMPDGASNPFMQAGGASSAMVPYTPSPLAQNVGYRARIGNVEVMFASEADFLKADKAWREQLQVNNVPSLGGSQGSGGSWLRTGANAADTVAGFLNGRNIRRKLEDLEDALADSRDARAELDNLTVKFPDLIPVLRRLFLAERDATEASVSVLEDQLTAVDIQTGSAVAKVAADFMGDRPASPAGGGDGIGTALAVGGAGLGLGLLMSNSRDDRGGRRRRPR